ncbi:MDR family MFS transporter [Pseudactinotalea sp.]|uniref:MDR family MFS transporter n=1 Tax=Pseudactinotalea sp. TaxID=1926260 RepID=UPI003B3B6714
MTQPAPPALQPPSERLDPRTRLVITLLLASAFVLILNETIMGVALSHIMSALRIQAATAQWVTTAFMLTMAVVIPVTGFLLQRLSTRTIYCAAMISFSVGTLICAIAPDFGILVGGRVVQAIGTAIMMPLLMTTVMQLVPPLRRGRVMGNISIVMSVAPAIGPAVSGLILSVLDWRGLFWVVLPLVLTMLVIGILRVPNVTEPRKLRLDAPSVGLSGLGFGGLIFGLSSIGESVYHPPAVAPAVPIAVGVVSLVLFVLRQRVLQRTDEALLDLRTFTSRTFTFSVLLMLVLMGALFGTIILLPLYLQDALHLESLQTGLLLVPGGLTMGLLGPIVGRLFDRWGPRPLVVPGCTLVAISMGLMTQLDERSHPGTVLALHVLLSIGLALTFTPLFTSALGSLRPQLYSHGSATIGTVQQLAGAAGTALFVVLMVTRQVTLEATGAPTEAALAEGVSGAFVAGAALAALAIPIAAMIRKPDEVADAPVGH